MHGSVFPLKAKQDGGWVRRIVVQEAVQLPPSSETNVIGPTAYRDLADAWDTWVSKPGSPSDELRAAQIVVPNRCKYLPMRVMNVAGYPVTLPVGAVLADLEAVEMVGDQPESASVGNEERDSEGDTGLESVSVLLNGVDPTLPTEIREALGVLLSRFSATFSTGKNELGRANAVQHRIYTGSNRPFRKALRRHPTVMVEAIDAQVGAMLKADFFEPAQPE